MKNNLKENMKKFGTKNLKEQDDFGMGVNFNPGSERAPDNKMIYEMLKEIKLLVNRVLKNTH